MQRIAIGEGVVRGLPVGMLVCGAKPGDAQRRGIGESATEIGCGGTSPQRRRQCRDDPFGIVGQQLTRQAAALSTTGRQQIAQFSGRRFAQFDQIERMTPDVQLLAAAGADQLIVIGWQHHWRLLPTDDIEAFIGLEHRCTAPRTSTAVRRSSPIARVRAAA